MGCRETDGAGEGGRDQVGSAEGGGCDGAGDGCTVGGVEFVARAVGRVDGCHEGCEEGCDEGWPVGTIVLSTCAPLVGCRVG